MSADSRLISTGSPPKLVLAANASSRVTAILVAYYARPVPNDPAASWAGTATPPRAATCSRVISTDSPISIAPSRPPSINSVR